MALMVTGQELKQAVKDETFIQGGDASCAEGVKYDFRLSQLILKAKWGRPMEMDRVPAEDLFIEPGEVVFVLSEERLQLPPDMVVILSPKRKMSHGGILSTGGLFIDPGYQGRLLLGLYNFSSSRWPLIAGKKMIAGTFHRLTEEERGDFPPPSPPLDEFPDDLVKIIREYEPVAVQAVAVGLDELKEVVVELRQKVRSGEDWVQRFQGYLDSTNKQIQSLSSEVGEVSKDLHAEIEARRQGQDTLTRTVAEISQTLSNAKAVAGTVLKTVRWGLGILGTIILGLIVAYLSGLLPSP